MVVDEVNKSLSDRELLILVNERLTTLNGKLDEYRQDNNAKYALLQEELKCSCERLQTQIDSLNDEIYKIKKFSYMQKGALLFIGGVLSLLSTAGAIAIFFD